MAGGSQIIISDKGIKITTNGKVIFQASEHVFEGGREVFQEIFTLPSIPTNYSFKQKYKCHLPYQIGGENNNLSLGKELFIISKKDNKLIHKTKVSADKDLEYSSSERFYTTESEDIEAQLFMSNQPFLFFKTDHYGDDESIELLDSDRE